MIAGSLVSLTRRAGADVITSGDVAGEGGNDCNIVYRATRWSGPVDFPAFGRLSTSTTAFFRSSCFSACFGTIILNNSIAFDRTTTLLDLEQFRIDVKMRLNASCGKGEGYARKNSQITIESGSENIEMLHVHDKHTNKGDFRGAEDRFLDGGKDGRRQVLFSYRSLDKVTERVLGGGESAQTPRRSPGLTA